ncbi:glycosyl transferase [Spirochaetia bacterium]|nr:glycosyl transferase [Spirochaetia bacterium]
MMPKIIHYCWLSDDPVPSDLKYYMATWKDKLIGYDFVLWNRQRFDINSSVWVKQAYEQKKYAFAADYIRLYAVYHYGGIYLDMDIELIKPFDDLLCNDLMFAYENNVDKTIEAGCFGAEKNSAYLKKCLDYYKDRTFIKGDGSYDVLPLPQILKNVFQYDAFQFYTQDYFTAKQFGTGIVQITSNTYCIHQFCGSWKSIKSRKCRLFVHRIIKIFGYNYFTKFIYYSFNFIERINKTGVKNTIKYYYSKF